MEIKIEGVSYNLSETKDVKLLCSKFAKMGSMLFGETADGEIATLSIGPECVIVAVYIGDRCRKNIYWVDGATEEAFET